MDKKLVCCVCLELQNSQNASFLNLRSPENSEKLKMFRTCVPGFNTKIIQELSLCIQCYSELCVAYEFKNKCISTKKKLKSYLERCEPNLKEVNLLNVLDCCNVNTEVNANSASVSTHSEFLECCVKVECHETDENLEQPAENEPPKLNKPPNIQHPQNLPPFVFKIHQCDCGKTFSRKEHLLRHRLTHTSIKPFDCTVCLKQFTRNEHLHRHMLVHTGDRPFECESCPKKFKRSEHLRRHRAVVHERVMMPGVDEGPLLQYLQSVGVEGSDGLSLMSVGESCGT